jgi:hypothetical protein
VSSASVRSIPALTARMLAPGCCEMLTTAASRPLPVTRAVRSGAPGKTRATSATRTATPLRTATGVWPISAAEPQSPEASTRCSRPPAAYRPTGARRLEERRAATTSSTVRLAASRRLGSATTSISRVSVADTSTRPTPGTRDRAGRTTKKA